MIVDYIKTFFQNLPDACRFKERKSRLLGSHRRKKTKGALKPVYDYIGMIIIGFLWTFASQKAVGINTNCKADKTL
jgi:hypothetical protein